MTTALRLVTGPQEFLATMRTALGRAHRRAWVETYIVSDDRDGRSIPRRPLPIPMRNVGRRPAIRHSRRRPHPKEQEA